MTNKKNKIIETALHLFANEAYDAVSTKRIAENAQVSEALIFKHFKNKKALLDTVVQTGAQNINATFSEVLAESDPKKLIKKTIETPFNIPESEFPYWRILLKHKWHEENIKENKTPLSEKLEWAFDSLDFKEPEKEAGILNMLLESITSNIILEGKPSQLKYKYFLIHRYIL